MFRKVVASLFVGALLLCAVALYSSGFLGEPCSTNCMPHFKRVSIDLEDSLHKTFLVGFMHALGKFEGMCDEGSCISTPETPFCVICTSEKYPEGYAPACFSEDVTCCNCNE